MIPTQPFSQYHRPRFISRFCLLPSHFNDQRLMLKILDNSLTFTRLLPISPSRGFTIKECTLSPASALPLLNITVFLGPLFFFIVRQRDFHLGNVTTCRIRLTLYLQPAIPAERRHSLQKSQYLKLTQCLQHTHL